MIRVEHLMKIFGPDPERALPLLAEGMAKDEIRERTGLTVGVNDVSFETEPGEIFVIMGLSGSGKSTLLRCINRLIEPVAGKVYLNSADGEIDVTALTDPELRKVRRERMSMVFQRFGLLPHRRVVDNVGYGLEIQGRDAAERRRLSEEMLEVVGLGGWGDSYPDELSGGMQQRVGLARALATQAEVLLMDEPFSALDPLIKVEMQDELLRIQNELKRTILFITHDLDEALRIGTHVAIMEGGVIVQQGTPEEIIVNPQSEYVSDFVEHADPTGVMTARTIMLPVPGDRFEERDRSDGITYYIRSGYPEREYGVDREGRFVELRVDGTTAEVRRLAEMFDEPLPDLRLRNTVLTCTPETVLKDVLRGRTYSLLPQLVLGDDGELLGVISENELVHGILTKRAYEDVAAPEAVAPRPATQEARR